MSEVCNHPTSLVDVDKDVTIVRGSPFQKTIEQLARSFASFADTWIVQRYLDEYKKTSSPSPDIIELYNGYLPLIKKVYGQKPRFHGTGRLRYALKGESKYNGGVDVDCVVDVLERVFTEGGIFPNSDPFIGIVSDAQHIDSQGVQRSISLSKSRLIAGLYAEVHQDNSDPLQYRFGHASFWKMYYLVHSILADPVSGSRDCLQVAFNSRHREYYTRWLKAVDCSQEYGVLRLLHGTPAYPFVASFKMHSRIRHNHGLLFGVSADSVNPLPIHNFFARFESRVAEPIMIPQLTHVEVPLNNLRDVKLKIVKFGLTNIPVLPMECTEWYMAQHALRELTPWG